MACDECPKRYMVVFFAFLGMMVYIGLRSCFTMVMVHITKSGGDSDSIFPNCTTNHTGNDLRVDWTGKSVLLLHTGYFCGSLLTQIPGGILAARFSSKKVCGLSFLVTTLLFLVLPFAMQSGYFVLVLIIRVVEGIAEGCTIPALNGVISAWAPRAEKSRLMTIVYSGAYLSPAVAMVTSSATTCYVSWNSIFFIYGGIGVVWSIVWLCFMPDTPASAMLGNRERALYDQEKYTVQTGSKRVLGGTPWTKILTSLPLSAIVIAAFFRNWVFAMWVTEAPQFFRDAYNMHTVDIGLLSSIAYVAMTVMVILGGFIVDTLIKQNIVSTTVGRKIAQFLGFGAEGSCLLALGFGGTKWTSVILMCVGVGFSGLAISGYQVNPLDLAPQYVSVLTGIIRLGMVGAIMSTSIAAAVAGNSHNPEDWHQFFLVTGSIELASALYYIIFASGNRQPWADSHLEVTVATSINDNESSASTSNGRHVYDYKEHDELLTKSLPYGFSSEYEEADIRFLNSL